MTDRHDQGSIKTWDLARISIQPSICEEVGSAILVADQEISEMDEPTDVRTATQSILNADWQVYETPASEKRDDRVYLLAKRLVDVVIAVVTLALLSPVLVVIALAIKLDSRGPVIFAQDRVGYDQRTGQLKIIKVNKFRTMVAKNDEEVHRAYVTNLIQSNAGLGQSQTSLKMQRDPRITRIGRVLRKTSLDELPQLINVLKGEMSAVGPRPALLYEVAAYQPWHRARLRALPGMTGWWQVMGRNRVSFDDMVRLDIYYIEHRSMRLDLKILLLTPIAVISGNGAG